MIFTDTRSDEVAKPDSSGDKNSDATSTAAAETLTTNSTSLPSAAEDLVIFNTQSENDSCMSGKESEPAAVEDTASEMKDTEPGSSGTTSGDQSLDNEHRHDGTPERDVRPADTDWTKESESQNKGFDADEHEMDIVEDDVVDIPAKGNQHGISVPEDTDTADKEVVGGEEQESTMDKDGWVLVDISSGDQHGVPSPEEVDSTVDKVLGGEEQKAEMDVDVSVPADVQTEVVKELADEEQGTSVSEGASPPKNEVFSGEEREPKLRTEVVKQIADDGHGASVSEGVSPAKNEVFSGEKEEAKLRTEVVKKIADEEHGASVSEEMGAAGNEVYSGEKEAEMGNDKVDLPLEVVNTMNEGRVVDAVHDDQPATDLVVSQTANVEEVDKNNTDKQVSGTEPEIKEPLQVIIPKPGVVEEEQKPLIITIPDVVVEEKKPRASRTQNG